VGRLGSVFTPEEGRGQRGRDLTASVRVARVDLGEAVLVEVPSHLPLGDEQVARVQSPEDPPGTLTLNLPTGCPDGVTVRLRGMGERGPEGRAGDLYVRVHLIGPANRAARSAEPATSSPFPPARTTQVSEEARALVRAPASPGAAIGLLCAAVIIWALARC
jgi:hypothetical protein